MSIWQPQDSELNKLQEMPTITVSWWQRNLVQGQGVTDLHNGVPSKLVLGQVHDSQESKLHTY
jgi:hypothetical protein